MNCSFNELISSGDVLSYNPGTVSIFHKKSLKIIENIIGSSNNKVDMLILIEKYLAENIFYDDEAKVREDRAHFENGKKRKISQQFP